MITGMNHTGIVVSDLDEAVEFYRDVIGFKLMYRRERSGGVIGQVVGYPDTHLKAAFLEITEGQHLELIQYLSPPPTDRPTEERNVLGACHLAFDVDSTEDTYVSLISRGAKKLNPPVEVAPGRTICYLQDPFGNWIELVEQKA